MAPEAEPAQTQPTTPSASLQDLALGIPLQPTRKPNHLRTKVPRHGRRSSPLWTEQSGPQNLDPDRLAARCFDRGDLLAGRYASGRFEWWEEERGGWDGVLARLHGVSYWMRQRVWIASTCSRSGVC